MPISPDRYEELIAKSEAAHRAARRDTLRDLLRTVVHIVLWAACGLAFFAFAFHVQDFELGKVFWKAAHLVWIAGFAFSILAAYRRGEKRGDW